jgi:hypothetical protein
MNSYQRFKLLSGEPIDLSQEAKMDLSQEAKMAISTTFRFKDKIDLSQEAKMAMHLQLGSLESGIIP